MPKSATGFVCRRLLLSAALIVVFSLLSYLILAATASSGTYP